MKKAKIRNAVILHILLAILAFIVLIPIYYLVVTTFKSGTEAALHPMALPESIRLDSYVGISGYTVPEGIHEHAVYHVGIGSGNHPQRLHVRVCAEPERGEPMGKGGLSNNPFRDHVPLSDVNPGVI